MKKRHIVLDARLQATGIGRYADELIAALGTHDREHRYTVVCANPQKFSVTPQGWTFVKTDIRHYSFAEQFRLPALLRSLQPDLVHFTHFNNPIFYRGLRVTTIHDLTLHFFPGNRMRTNPLRNWSYRLVMRAAAVRSAHILVPSESTQRDVAGILDVPLERMSVTPEGVDERFFAVARVSKRRAQARIKQRLGIEPPYILYVGVWSEHKNIERLIEAFEMLSKSGMLAPRLVIAGTPNPHYPNLKARIAASPARQNILTPGFIADELLPYLYRGAQASVLVSLYEGFGLPVIESQATGTPVVAANTTSLPEAGGEAALYVNPLQPSEIATALGLLVQQTKERERRVRLGIARARQFRWSSMADKTLFVYNQVLRRFA